MMWVTLLALAGGAGFLFSLLLSRKRLDTWRYAATSCGLQVVEAKDWRLKARAGSMAVRMEGCRWEETSATRIVVAAPGPPDFDLVTLRSREFLNTEGEVEIGDSDFDSAFFIEGPKLLLFAILDAETRQRLLLVSARHRLQISDGALQVELLDEYVPRVLPLLLDLRQRFHPSLDIPRRLAENARQDPEGKVRLENLLLLAHEFPGEPATLQALCTACADPNPEIQMRAAKELGVEGRKVLLEVAELMDLDAVSAGAVSILGRELPVERAASILERALRMRRLQTALACLEALSNHGAATVDVVVAVMEQEQGKLAVAAAKALEKIGSPAAEPSLILTLQREPADLQVAAAKALGRVGSVKAVSPLKEASERSWRDRELRRASRQAIAEIQSRLHGASPGQLSLAETEAGQLSLATDPTGQLSLPPEEAEND